MVTPNIVTKFQKIDIHENVVQFSFCRLFVLSSVRSVVCSFCRLSRAWLVSVLPMRSCTGCNAYIIHLFAGVSIGVYVYTH